MHCKVTQVHMAAYMVADMLYKLNVCVALKVTYWNLAPNVMVSR